MLMVILVLINLIGLLLPLAGLICYFLHVPVILYIGAAYWILFALQRISRGDVSTILGVLTSIALTAILAAITRSEFLPLAAAMVCADSVWSNIKLFWTLRRTGRGDHCE